MADARILVVDDDPNIVALLKTLLQNEGYVTAVATNVQEALDQAVDFAPNAMILDLNLGGEDGLQVLRELRNKRNDQVPVLVLTNRDEIGQVVEGLNLGADDYIPKPDLDWKLLLARLQALLRRASIERPEVLRYADLELNTGARVARRGNRTIRLSTTEYGLLALLMRRQGQVVTRDTILNRVWGWDFEGRSNVLDVYIKYLRDKLEADGESRLIHTMRGTGYSLREQADD